MNSTRMFMNIKSLKPLASLVLLALLLAATSAARAASGDALPNASNAPIAWGDLGAKATAQYSGAGLSVFTAEGAVRLRCAFQKLEGEVTREGLWLSSTVPGAAASRFRVVAARPAGAGELRVVDATGKELAARLEVIPVGDEVTSLKLGGETSERAEEQSLLTSAPTSGTRLAVVVADAAAVYPVRIDPTFRDANRTDAQTYATQIRSLILT